MIHPILKIDETTDTSQGYFYDHLHNQLYLVKNGQLVKKSLEQPDTLVHVLVNIHANQNTNKKFPSLEHFKGECKFNLQKTAFVTISDNPCSVRTDLPISNGTVWQWHIPGSLKNVKLGVLQITKNNNSFETYVEIVASSSRTVTFYWIDGHLKTWVNGKPLSREHSKEISSNNERQSQFYPFVTCSGKGQTIIFNPFGPISNFESSLRFKSQNAELKPTEKKSVDDKISKIVQLNKDKFLLISQNQSIKLIHRNSRSNNFEFPSISISQDGKISGIFSQQEFDILNKDGLVQQFWNSFKSENDLNAKELKSSLQKSISIILLKNARNQTEAYRILLQKVCILRSISSQFEICNLVHESQLDREFYSETSNKQYFDLNQQPLNNIPKSVILNQQGWTSIDGKISDITQNYILSIDQETVIIYHIGDTIKEVFRQNIVFFEFNKNSFLESYTKSDLKSLKKGQKNSSIYKILANCFSKQKKVITQIYPVKENDLKQMVNDYRISESDAKLSLEQTGNVEDALVWLSQSEEDRVYIAKYEQHKGKGNDQQVLKGSLLQLTNTPFVKLLLKVNKQVYLLGYDPESLSKNIIRNQKQFINLFDFKREATIEEIDQSQWFNSQNHKTLSIVDSLSLKQNADFLCKSQNKIYLYKSQEGNNQRAGLNINSQNLFENEPSLSLNDFEPFKGDNITKDINGELFDSEKLSEVKSYNEVHIFICNTQLFTNLTSNTEKILQIEVFAENQSFKIDDDSLSEVKSDFIPLIIQKGPIGCNMHYEISSILTPGSSFLANYSQEVKFRNQHSKFMKVTSVTIERDNKKMTVNDMKQAWVYFENDSGIRSKKYHVVFNENDKKKEIQIAQEGYWKYMILSPVFNKGKKMPFEFGFVGVKGLLIQSQLYEELLLKKIEQSVRIYDSKNVQKTLEFEVRKVEQISNNILKLTVKTSQPANSFKIQTEGFLKSVLSINNKSVIKPDLNQEEEQESKLMKNIQTLNSKDLLKLFERSHLQVAIMKEIAKKQKFSFKSWESDSIRKFIDLTFLKSDNLKNNVFDKVFDKILQNEQGKKYVDQLCGDIGKCYNVFPYNHLTYLIRKMSQEAHKENLNDLLTNLQKLKSQTYKDIKKQKIPYLLLEDNFYNKFYLQEIQKRKAKGVTDEQQKISIFEEESLIPAQFVVLKDENSRKIYVKIQNGATVSLVVLRFDRTQLSSKVNYRVYSLQNEKKLLTKGSINEQQWTQLTKLSHSQSLKELLGNKSSLLNALTIPLSENIKTNLIEIEILYTQTGIQANETLVKSFPFIDIVPEIYGQSNNRNQLTQCINSFPQISDFFNFKEQESFYLSTIDLAFSPLQKYSISKENQYEYNYFKPAAEKLDNLRRNIAERIEKKDYHAAIPDHKRLVNSNKNQTKKVNLDYVYTLLMFTLEKIFKNQIPLDQRVCQSLFEKLVQEDTGPIKIAAFKAISGSVTYLINSLPYVEQQGYMPNLEKVTFKKSQLQEILDLKNVPLCHSLNKLVVNCIPYENQWAKFLIKITSITQRYEENIKYIVKSNKPWYEVEQILAFFQQIPENYFTNVLLTNIEGVQLQKFILESKKQNKTLRTHLLIDKLIQIYRQKIDLDIVSMMLQEKDVKWHNLYKIIKVCPEAEDLILTQFLQTAQQNPQKLAQSYPEIIIQCSKSVKHSENFASFLRKLFEKNRTQFKKSILNLQETEVPLHSDILEVLTFYLYEQCNFGGIEGCKLLKQGQLLNIYVALILIKKIDFSSIDSAQFRQVNQEDILIEWYFCNNSYELSNNNPANKSPAIHLMKSLSQKVLQLIQNRPIQKILKVFDRLIKEIQSESIPLSTKHIYINQINEGVSQLLGKSINPTSLSDILVGQSDNQMLQKIFVSLRTLNSKSKSIEQSSQLQNNWKNAKQIDFIEKFAETSNIKDKVKDWQTNRNGSKNVLFKVPLSQGKIFLRSSNSEGFILSKIIVGFNSSDNTEKNNIYPSDLQVFGGQNQNNLIKICELKQIQDQHFQSFNTRVYGVNLNSLPFRKCASPIQTIEIRLSEPLLTSVSDIFENSQKVKKDAFYSVSFISLMGYESQPKIEPAYNQIYMTLLSFLSDQKYGETLKKVIESEFFKEKSSEFLKLLNSMLPNKSIQSLLLALNKQNQDVLGSIFQNDKPNIQLVELLMEANPSAQNIKKLLKYFIESNSEKLTPILVSAIKMFGYQNPDKKIDVDVKDLLKKYEAKNFKGSIFTVLTTVLSSPSTFNFNYLIWIEQVWKKDQNKRVSYYKLVGATIAYYNKALENFLQTGKTAELVEELLIELSSRKPAVNNQIYLLSQLSLHEANRQYLIDSDVPINLVNSLRNEETLIVKEYGSSMKYFILLFQSTCIQSVCEERFSEVLIDLMVKLPQVPAAHHNFFIHEFFFPLINAFKGIPVKFIWKNGKGQYLNQATHSLRKNPIKYDENVLVINDLYLEKCNINDWSQVSDRSKYVVLNNNNEIIDSTTAELSDKPECENRLFKIINKETSQLLTNQTLIKLKNLGIFGSQYMNSIPVQDSTFQNIYYLPCEMTFSDILKQINLCGFRLNQEAIETTKFFDHNVQYKAQFDNEKPLEEVLPTQQRHFAVIQVNPETFFSTTSIEQIVKKPVEPHIFIPQQTIFKTFERKEGLLKMITVLKTCVKNWSNYTQAKIWEQYLNELQSYSCFPVFSSIYMNKQENVQLLFDILSGLPNKQDSKKWTELEKTSVKFLYNIIKDVFQVQGAKALQIREYAVQNGFYKTMLQRLHLVSKEPKRVKVEQEKEEEEELFVPTDIKKIASEQDYKLKVVKKKGIGYGNDSSTNQKWDVTGQQQSRKELSNQISEFLKILEKFLDHRMFEPPKQIVEETFESALLPIIESSLRGGSLLEISKSAELFKGELSFIKALTKKKCLVPILMSIPKCYEPKQHQSIFELLKVLEGTSKIFLSCLTGSVSEKLSQQIAKGIIETYELVEAAVSNYQQDHVDQDEQKKILQLPLAKKYPLLLKDLRFDYVDMKDKNGKISKHHYSSNFVQNHKNPPAKTIRLAQQLADISHALPVEHTNAIYVRCDKERVDFMQALIMGSNGTPYGHGAYLFDIYFDDTYPNNPPKVNLTTTGNGQIRFNPNLYSCGKVCLSLLGTWRGSAMENWDPKVSTLLQILVSIQSIIMSEQVYFNEPGFQHEQGTIEGEKKNQAYANIVRYGNIKFAMIQNIKNPPKGFEHIIKRHFYLKKDEILEETKKWLKYAEKREASYNGLVSDHNNNWCNTFKKSKTEYKTMLEKAIKELEQQLNKLPEPSHKDLKPSVSSPKKQKKKTVKIESKDENIEEVDVQYDKNQQTNLKELDINDEKVKDRWSRYIGAMGIEAVSKQSKASILLFGLGATGVQIAKNIILSGCKKISIVDDNNTTVTDLSGQFFLGDEDIGKNRVDACLYKLQQLNHYVRVQNLKFTEENIEILKQYDVVILTEQLLSRQKLINDFCHQNDIKFIITDCYGPFGQHFNDFGKDFQVLDKNGEETVEVMIESITNAEKGVVTLLNKQRHPYEDGEAVRITGVKGMFKQNGESINGTIHKIRVINQYSFEIGNTTEYSPYEVDGLARNMKIPVKVEFKSFEESLKLCNIDNNLAFYDFEKSTKNTILHNCFITLSGFRQHHKKYPLPWNWEDGQTFLTMLKQIYTEELKTPEINFIRTFAYTCSGNFAPLAAFYGGLTAQQVFKAITGKYMPINQYFFTEFTEVVPSLPQTDAQIQTLLQEINYKQNADNRNEGLRRVVGNQLIDAIQKCRVFVIGSGAIGCELLKNYAMINLATSKTQGEIIVTDPDHIQESNLNRQFLFREKHLRKPKSVTAAAAVSQMNKLLKGKIRAKLDRVCQSTKDIFSNEFFESLNIVTNALDNVKARQYVDQRCVENKVALLESGTLSSKGHVQVIIPYLTETYGSKNDPAEQGQIPHCTLKMFPEQTLHCVEWARDIFGKTFTLDPKALGKLLEKWKDYTPTSSDLEMLKSCSKMLEKKPQNFEEAIYFSTLKFYELYRNDIKQLLYTYPLDAKTKDGKPFWKLPKRPPTPVEQIDPNNELHSTFITSYAVLLCKVFNVEYPKDFRKEERKVQICKEASKIKIEPFVPNDKLAKQMAEQVEKNENTEEKLPEAEEIKQNETEVITDEKGVFDNIKKVVEESKTQIKVNAEEFEKDDDQNGHIDLIYSMANLRASNYKLQPMDWMTTKLKAGRITPALSTTTSCVAALQTIQLIKYLKKCKLDKMRNTFINLAVPMIQAGQPGQVEKIKIHDDLTTNIWQRWEIGPINLDKITVGQLLTAIEDKYKIQVKILSILQGAQIYSDLVYGLQSKKQEKEEYLRKSLKEVLLNEISAEDLKKFVDMTLVFGVNEELAKHVPTLRVKLEE